MTNQLYVDALFFIFTLFFVIGADDGYKMAYSGFSLRNTISSTVPFIAILTVGLLASTSIMAIDLSIIPRLLYVVATAAPTPANTANTGFNIYLSHDYAYYAYFIFPVIMIAVSLVDGQVFGYLLYMAISSAHKDAISSTDINGRVILDISPDGNIIIRKK